jgi:Rrf2 family protein
MKFTAQEEYGLRCLLRVAGAKDGESVTIPEIAEAEGLSVPYVGKLMSVLRQAGFVTSVRGQSGGYVLSRAAGKISVTEVLMSLGGRLYEPGFCDEFVGLEQICTRSTDCAIRSLWRSVQQAVDRVLTGVTLRHLLGKEYDVSRIFSSRADV